MAVGFNYQLQGLTACFLCVEKHISYTQETRLNSSQCVNDVNTQCIKIRKVILLLSCIRIGRYKNDP